MCSHPSGAPSARKRARQAFPLRADVLAGQRFRGPLRTIRLMGVASLSSSSFHLAVERDYVGFVPGLLNGCRNHSRPKGLCYSDASADLLVSQRVMAFAQENAFDFGSSIDRISG